MARSYSCAVCNRRVKPCDRRPITNKILKKKVSTILVRDVTTEDRLCVNCRIKISKSLVSVPDHEVPIQPAEPVEKTFLSPQNIQLKLLSTPRNKKRCVICKKTKKLVCVGQAAVAQAFLAKGVYINKKSRCCREHLQRTYFTTEALSTLSSTKNSEYFSRSDIVELLDGIRSHVNSNGVFNFDIPSSLSDTQYREITGLTKDQFDDLTTFVKTLKSNTTRSTRSCLAVFLAKLKTGVPNHILSTIFNLSISQVQRIIHTVRKCLMTSFVPQHLGFGHIDHDVFAEMHTTPIAKELFTSGNNDAVLVLDGTYLYIQKSSDYRFQRQSYSLHKNRPLVKPMMVVASDGYILSVLGPYLAEYGNNDANITKHILNNNLEEVRSWLRKDDIFIVDRGFRDAVEYLEGIGLKVEMPSYLTKGKKQHTVEEANLSRLVTKVRWVIESVNGRLKQFRLFDKVIPTTFVPHIGDLVRITCAVFNRYRKPLASMDPETQQIAKAMIDRNTNCNRVQTLVEENGLLSRRSCYQQVDEVDFPRLTLDNLRNITLGVYQVKQAPSYTKEHLDSEGYEMMLCQDLPDLLKVKIQSRHSKKAVHSLWVQYSSEREEIRGWYCTCKVGARVVGCCAHVASVLWYLGYKRHTEYVATKNSLSSMFLDAATNSGTFSENDPLEE
ncbi:uncharacterized protein [Argopecten irradians]|uniref:uncharacterized protein n=1 Tax=Argopecten irradians TaxID=31199 RepID=UPI003713D661